VVLVLTVADAPWPGFFFTRFIKHYYCYASKGTVLIIHQKMFESRLFVDKLIDICKVILCDPHRATVID
jgi:UDP-N-acetylglucosamine 1-carboxyvinyltransferase